MVQTLNFISLSSQQAPNDVDWPGLVKAGVQGALIRLGHGIIRDPCASGHIAKAKQYGLYWHGYHTYEGVVNEPQFTIKNATDLGLSNSQYYFVDLAKSSDPFNDYYALHATWLSQGYSTGLLISNDDYLSKFKDSEVIASGTLRWLISDTEPADYDVWQYSSEGTVGISSVKVGFNFSKTDKLKYNLDTTLTGADINKDPYNPETPVGGAYIGWGYDTTGLGGGKTIGYSTDGKNFYALIGPDGLIVRKNDGNRIYGTIADQIDSAISANVIPAKSAADSAVSAADAAVASAQVTSDAVTAIASATAEAKQGANEAMSRAESAWDVATGAKEAVTDFDPLLKSAQSDAKQASETATSAYEQSRSAYDAVKADSSAVVAMQSSMAGFREDVASAQSVADSAKADAGKALTQIADTASALSDAKAALGSDVAEAKGLANTAQTTADNAVKSASSVAGDLTAVASQEKSNAEGITKVTSDVGLLQTTVANNSGNISTIQETAKQIQQAVSDNAGNIMVATQTADSAVAVASDARSNATVAIQTASQASITAINASGQAASAVLTASGAMTTASNAKSDATVAVQTASGASLTATDAKDDATIAKQTASEAIVQASNAESDFAQLSIRADKIEANVANNSGAIASVQQTANGLTTTVGNVDDRVKTIEDKTNWTTKTGSLDMNTLTTTQNIYYRDTNLQNADGETGWAYIQVVSMGERVTQTVWHDRSSIQHTRTGAVSGSSYNWDAWNKTATYAQVAEVKQTVDGLSTLVSDPKAGMTATYQTASQASLTAQNASGQAVTAVTTAQGAVTTANNAQSYAVVAKQTASEASVTAGNAAGDASVAKQTASQASISVQNAQSDITSLDARADSLETFQKDASGNINKLVSRADGVDQTLTSQKGDISSLQSRAGKLESSMSTANGQISTLQQTTSGLTTSVSSISDQLKASGHKVKVQSSTFNTSGNYSDAGVWLDGTRVGSIGSGISFTMGTLNLDWSGYTQKDYATTSSLVSDLLALQDKIVVIYMADAIPSYGSDLVNALAKMGGDSKLATATSVSYRRSPFIFIGMSLDTNGKQVLQEGEGYLNTGTVGDGQVKYAWGYEGDSNKILTSSTIGKVTEIKTTIDGINTTINDPKTGLNATYQTAQGNTTTISSVKGDVSQLQATANGLTSRVGNLESKTNTQQTTIDQNKAAIALKADQTAVDKINGTVSQLQSTLTVQAGQIQEKVTSSQVTGMLSGYATQDYTQSLVTQKANDWNLNLTNLKTDVNAIKTNGGGVNLLQGTRDFSGNNWLNFGTNWAKTDETYNGLSVVETTGDWSGVSQYYQVKQGETYTFSLYARYTSGTGTSNFYIGLNSNPENGYKNAQVDNGALTCSLDTNWKKYSITFTAKADGYIKPRMERTNANKNVLRVCGFMLEKGTVAHDWSPAPSDMATVTSVTNLSATVDGIQAQVYNSDGSSKITQLSNLIATKVSQGDYNSQITQFQNDINLRVKSADLISQINLQAGTALIQSNKLVLDAGTTVVTGNAFIPVAAIADLTADQVQAGTLSGSKVHAGDNSGNAIDMGAISAGYVGFHAYANNGDNTYIDYNGIHNYGASYDTRIQQGKITTNYLTVNGGGMIDFRDSNGTGMVAQGSTLTFDVGNTPAGYLSYNGMPVAEIPDGSGGNELAIRYGQSAAIIPNDNSGAQATFSGAAQKIGYMTGTNQGKQMLSGLEVHSNNHHWFGAVNSDATWNRIEINSNDGVNLAWHDQTHFWISDGKAKLYKDNNDSQTATELEVHGWAWVNGWVEAAGHSQHSTLSSKTRIEEADPDYMLDLVNNTDLTTFAFKSEVAEGLVVRHIGPIIDDVNDVAQYRTPAEFIAPTKTARDDDNMIGALFGAVQALTKRIKKLEDKLNG